MLDAPPHIQKLMEAIRRRAEAGGPLGNQRAAVMETLRLYLAWRLSPEQLTDAHTSENEQGYAEAAKTDSN